VSGEKLKAAVLTVSDSAAAGRREDLSGPEAARLLARAGYEVAERAVVPDEQGRIEETLRRLCDGGSLDLVLTTGGTGFGPRDCTPEATEAVVQRRAPNLAETMRVQCTARNPNAALSRGAAGVRCDTLIVNLPGSPKAVAESLDVLLRVLEHGLRLLRGQDLH